MILALLVFTAASGFGYRHLTRVEAETATARLELRVALAKVEAAETQISVVQNQAERSAVKVQESEASLAKLSMAAKKKEKVRAALQGKLQSLLEDGQGQVTLGKDGRLTLQLVDKVLFRSGESELTTRGERVMARVGTALLEMDDKQFWVQGHTDDVPVSEDNEDFSSNWELSAARALTVVHYLQDQSGVNPRRLAAAAFGSHRPVSRKNKSKNRRIEIVLFPLDVKLRR